MVMQHVYFFVGCLRMAVFFAGDVSGAYASAAKREEQVTEEQDLLRSLRINYDPAIRPVFDAKRPVIIDLGITLTQIIDVDEKNQVLTTNVWLDQEWWDEKLSWNRSKFFNISSLRIPCHLIWLPDIVLYNSVENHNRGYMKSLAMVQHTGRVFWPPIVRMRSSCKMDITYFPFDDQICFLKLGSWAYDGFQVDVMNRSQNVDLSNYVDNGEWELVGTRMVRTVRYYPCCPEPFPDIRFFLHIRRRVLYYLLNVIVPCMLLSSLSFTAFLLPPDSGEKVTLGLTVLLAFSVFMLLVADTMPPTSEYIPLIGVYLTVIMGMSGLSVALSVLVLSCHHRGATLRRPPRLIRILAKRAGHVLCLHVPHLQHTSTSRACRGSSFPSCGYEENQSTLPHSSLVIETAAERDSNRVIEENHVKGNGNVQNHMTGSGNVEFSTRDRFSNGLVLDPFLQGLDLWDVPPDSSSSSTNADRSSFFLLKEKRRGDEGENVVGDGGGEEGGGNGRGQNRSVTLHVILEQILHRLHTALQLHELWRGERVAAREWQEVARVMDRLFFWLTLTLTATSTVGLLLFSPMSKDVNVLDTV